MKKLLAAMALLPMVLTASSGWAADKLVIGSSLSQTPWGFYDDAQQPTGIDVALCGALAKEVGAEAEYVNLDFKGLIPALQADRFNMICAAVYITPERQKIVKMIPYIRTSQAILTAKDSQIASMADLCGRSVSVLQGSAQLKVVSAQSETCTAEGKSAVQIQSFDTQPIAVRALENGSVEAFFASDQLVSYYLLKNPALRKAATGINPVTLGIAVKMDNSELETRLREGLKRMKEKGTYDLVLKEWGIETSGVDSFDP